jgi:hypothetical protein
MHVHSVCLAALPDHTPLDPHLPPVDTTVAAFINTAQATARTVSLDLGNATSPVMLLPTRAENNNFVSRMVLHKLRVFGLGSAPLAGAYSPNIVGPTLTANSTADLAYVSALPLWAFNMSSRWGPCKAVNIAEPGRVYGTPGTSISTRLQPRRPPLQSAHRHGLLCTCLPAGLMCRPCC